MKTSLIVGDVHGCLSTLKALIAKAGPVDSIILVGDLIDRGPDSIGVVQYCIDNNIQVCLANHELMFLDAMSDYLGSKHPYQRMGLLSSDWWANGGKDLFPTLTDEDITKWVAYFSSLPVLIKTDYIINDKPVIISHTCLNNYSYDILNASPEDLKAHALSFVWSRTQSLDVGKFYNIYGHTPTDYLGIKDSKPRITSTGINLDTGCCYDSADRSTLTGVLLPSLEIIQERRQW